MMGTVKWFSRKKGWGFIEAAGAPADVFVHYSSIEGGRGNLYPGQAVAFDLGDGEKGPTAVNVVPGPAPPDADVRTHHAARWLAGLKADGKGKRWERREKGETEQEW